MEKYRVRSRWVKMLSRCEDEDNPQYHDYGGRGIYVCDEWREFGNFYDWCVANGIDSELQLDRQNNDGPYEPWNCKFVTRLQNQRNRRNTFFIEAFGERKTMMEWTEDDRCSVSYPTLQHRMGMSWSAEDAISKPTGTRMKRPHNEKAHEAFGVTKTLRKWSTDDRCVVSYGTLNDRVNRMNWNVERALSQPTGKQAGIR